MVKLKTLTEIEKMRQAGEIAAAARALAGEMVTPGVTTHEIDRAVHAFILSRHATPTFLHYCGYPASVCVSVNDEVIHGIPGKRKLEEGDVVSIDVGATYKGFVGDCAATFIAGDGTDEAKRLIAVTRQSFFEGIANATPGHRVGDIGAAVQRYVEENGFSVVRDYVGHGVGAVMHEDPEVPNYATGRPGPRLYPGMTLAVEPMVNAGIWQVRVLRDGWTVKTADGSLSAHYENSILITDGKPEILTAVGGKVL